MTMSFSEVSKISRSRNATLLEKWVAKLCVLGVQKGDTARLDFMFDKIFGKVKTDSPMVNLNIWNLSREEQISAGRAAIQYLEKAETE